MSTRNFRFAFAPASVALIGASRKPQSVGAVLAENLFAAGFPGAILPVNPHETSIAGALAYQSVAELPLTPELAVICTPPDTVPGLIAELGERGTRAAVVLTAGFGELGDEGKRLQREMLEAARPHLLRVIGPNCVGIMVPSAGLNASFAPGQPAAGDIGFVSQSGAVVTAVLDWAAPRGIGFSHVVSLGGMADVDFGDMLGYLAEDEATRSIVLYVEAITHARKFLANARKAARSKPVVVVKSGRHAEGAKAAASHTGALAGSDAVYDTAFRRAGMLRVRELEDLFDAVETLGSDLEVTGERLAILTNGGGLGVMATDRLMDAGGRLAELSPKTVKALDEALPRTWSKGNPVDIIGDAPGSRYSAALEALLTDRNTDAVLVINCPTAIADSMEAARAVVRSIDGRDKTVLASWLGEAHARESRAFLQKRRVPVFETPENAIRAFAHHIEFRRNQKLMRERPRAAETPKLDEDEIREIVAKALGEGRERLGEPEAKRLLAAAGIPVVPTEEVGTDPEAAAEAAVDLGFPAALKVLSPDISHKSDVGGVVLDLADAEAVAAAVRRMLKEIPKAAPKAKLTGFSVQPMATMGDAYELILGLDRDPVFGPVILFGEGGTAVEVVRDSALELPPLNRRLANDLIDATRISKRLRGFRNHPGIDHEALIDTLLRLSQLAELCGEIAELDINPLLAGPAGVLALDARIRLDPDGAGRKPPLSK